MTKSIRWFALGAAAVALGACSDSIVSPTTRAPGAAAYSATLNGNSFTIASDGSSQFCGASVLGVFATFPASFAGITSGCVAAEDLQTDGSLGAYNPGWDQLTGGDWIGFQTNGGPSSDYRPTPGIYVFQQTFVLPTGVTAPSLSLTVRADNVVAVYLNGHHLGEQAMVDCNDGAFGACHWTSGGQLVVTAPAADFNANPATNYITFLVNDVPTGYPDLVPPPDPGKGGPAPQYGCTTRTPQATGSHLFTNDGAVNTVADGHAGPLPTGNAMSPTPTPGTNNPGQVGCENPAGLAFAGSVNWTPAPPPSGIWCSPGFWKNHGINLWVPLQGLKYNASGPYPNAPQSFAPPNPAPKKGGSTDPTLLQVIQNPNQYGGDATNNVASFISLNLFGTPESANPKENCPDQLPLPPV